MPVSLQGAGLMAGCWALCSVLLLLFRPGYLFPPFELLDSWIYTSYQWAPRAQIADFGVTYYGSRLSWILPGALLHHYLPPVAAELVFKLGASAVLAGAVGLIVHAGHGPRWGAVGVIATVCFPAVIQAFHADYIDTPVFTYAAVTAAFITWSRDARWWPLWIGAAGGSLMLMLVANLGALSSVGLALGVYHLAWLRWSVRRHALSLACYAAGAGVVFCAIGAMHAHLGGPFYFIKPQVDMVLFFKNVKSNPWAPTDPHWFLAAHWLILPFASLAWGAYCSFFLETKDARTRTLLRSLTAALTTSLGVALYVEMRRTASVLSLYYYTSFHLAFALPLLAVCCASSFRPLLRPWHLGTLLAGSLLIVLCLPPLESWPALASLRALLARPEWFAVVVAVAVGLPVTLVALLLARKWPVLHTAVATALPFGLALASVSKGLHGPEISNRLCERYQSVHDAFFAVESRFPRGTVCYWVDGTNRNGVSLASTKLWGYRLLTLQGFPELSTEASRFIGYTVIVPLNPGGYDAGLAKARAALKPFSLEANEPELIRVPGAGGMGFDLLTFKLQARTIDPEEPRAENAPMLTMIAGLEYYGANRYTGALNYHRQDPAAKPPVVDTAGDYPVLHRSAPGDFAATHFRALPEIPYGKMCYLMVVTVLPAKGNCVVMLQDENFRVLGKFTLTEGGRSVHSLGIPYGTKSYRICFLSPQEASTPVPVNINVYQMVK